MSKLLIQKGADVNAKAKREVTPLHTAVIQHDLELVELLLDAGADPSAADSSGVTPRAIAARNGDTDIVAALDKALAGE